MVALFLAVDAESGPVFTADPHRMNVAITRQQCALFVFGDIDTIPEVTYSSSKEDQAKAKKTVVVKNEDGGEQHVRVVALSKLLQMFLDMKRVVDIQGD